MTPEMFKCKPLDVKLTRKACGERHKRMRGGKRTLGDSEVLEVRGYECSKCEIGIAHAKGETPAVELVQIRLGKVTVMA